jgi:hypothetical protein
MHVLGGVRQQVTVLVERAALDRQVVAPERHERSFQPRGTIDEYEFGPLQAAALMPSWASRITSFTPR